MNTVFIIKTSTIIASLLSAALYIYVFRQRKLSKPLWYYAGLMLANTVYATFYFIELHVPNLNGAILCLNFEYLGLSFVPSFWVLIAWSYNNRGTSTVGIENIWRGIIFLIPAVIVLLVWTNPLHHLIYTDISLTPGLPLTVLQTERAPFFWVINALLSILHVLGTGRLIYSLVCFKGRFKMQFSIMISATILPTIAHIFLLMKKVPYNMDLGPSAFGISGLLLFWGMIKMQLFDLMPIARNMVLEAIDDAVFVVDLKYRLVECNKSAKKHLAKTKYKDPEKVMEWTNLELWQKLLRVEDSAEIQLTVESCIHFFKVSRSSISHGVYGTLGYLYILHDITEIKSYVEKLETLASIDGLTGLFNRRHFMQLAKLEVSRVDRYDGFFSMIIFDLDHFKKVNDKFGHSAGDEALQMVGRLVMENTRAGDLYARYGGEEFVLLYRETTPEQAELSIERLRIAIETAQVYHNDKRIPVTASFGISYYKPGTGMTLEKCLNNADTAMYEAKRQGRNRICHFDPLSTVR